MMRRNLSCVVVLILAAVSVTWGAAAKVEFKESQYKIDVLIDGKLFTSYMHTMDPSQPTAAKGVLQTKPVLYPIMSPSGVALTRSFPLSPALPGEATDHPHHIGIWFTVDQVGPDNDGFWNNSKTELPAIKHIKVLKLKGGSGSGLLATISHWIGKAGKPVLEEEREMIFRPVGSDQIQLDFSAWLKAVDQDITVRDTKEGMFAIRVAQWLTEKDGGRYLNSSGQELEKGVWGRRADWVRLQGTKDGKPYGIAILNHPKSTNSPTWWHARGYGCFSVNPLGQLDFEKTNKAPDPKPFNLTIKKGERALFKYRVVFYEGEMDQAKTAALQKAWAK